MVETKKFDVPEVLAALEAAVAKKGEDYVYEPPRPKREDIPSCLYTHRAEDGTLTPGCIVGQVYFDLTGSLIPLASGDQEGGVITNKHTGPAFTAPATRVLVEAQICQDSGSTWGEALAAAREAAE